MTARATVVDLEARRRKKARHREIARRYAWKRKQRAQGKTPVSISALRAAELDRIFEARYGQQLPDDDAGRDDVALMVHHLSRSREAETRIPDWLSYHAPWMTPAERRALLQEVAEKPRRWKADTLAQRLGLKADERARLKIRTIGAIDQTKAERAAARRARDRDHARERMRRKRASRGGKSRTEYEAAALVRAKPWVRAGISRATWYRRNRPAAVKAPAAGEHRKSAAS